ncbi:MAG: DMT family transporter [Lachnospiraceae bacterium]|nr:DMT family transporter [Lachnospiraceae bacterium]
MDKNKKQGILFIIGAGFCFALMTFFVRMAGDLPTIQKAFFRNVVAVFVAFVLLLRSKQGFRIQKGSIPGLLARSFFGTCGILCNFYAADHLHIADASMLNKLSPFFAIAVSYIILKEKANAVEWISVVLALIGAAFVVKPTSGVTSLYGLVGVAGGLAAGLGYTFIRYLGKRGERGPVIVLWFSLFSCLATAPVLLFDYHPMSGEQLLYLLLTGLSATGGQLCITKAYTKAAAKEISVFDYSQVIFAAILGWIFLSQLPDVYSWIGYVIIIGTAVAKWRYMMHRDRAAKEAGQEAAQEAAQEARQEEGK